MRRGEVYEYRPVIERPGQSRARLVVSGQAVNDADRPIVLGLQVLDLDPGGLLSVRLGEVGWASVLTIEVVMRRRLGGVLHVATDEEMEAVDIALRAAQDLEPVRARRGAQRVVAAV